MSRVLTLFQRPAQLIGRDFAWAFHILLAVLDFTVFGRNLDGLYEGSFQCFFATDFRDETYTVAGMKWVRDNDMRSVLLRHFPELAPALAGVANPFAPWNPVSARPAPAPSRKAST